MTLQNTLVKNVLCQEDTLDPDGFNRNQVKVPSRSAPVALVLLLALQHHQMNED